MSNGAECCQVGRIQQLGPGEHCFSMTFQLTGLYHYMRLMRIFSQAQYYRDPANLETYLSANHFLPYINNEIQESRNETYKRNLASLDNLVLVMFTEDKTVIPKESSWFGAEVVTEEEMYIASQMSQISFSLETGRVMVPMRLQPIYLEDWIGLRDLDERGAIIFEECEGEHMRLGKCWEPLVKRFTGGLY
jgi:palmitoyl-protein thioesterase